MVTKSNSPFFTIFGQCGFYPYGFVLVSATSHHKFKENIPLKEVVRITQSDISKPISYHNGRPPISTASFLQYDANEKAGKLSPPGAISDGNNSHFVSEAIKTFYTER